ncbi:hypothetical protein J6590_077424 [Homalodisca vitripennis]|nr:hypothetical protein J6590_077424 [Homalodisca vitripennis]
MKFTIELSQKGKPCLHYDGYKYREHRTLVNGDINWRCLGRTCGASVRTDQNRTELTVCNKKHSGTHPVTMHTLSQSPATPRPASSCSSMTPTLSPLISELINKKKCYTVETQTDDDSLRSKDQLLARISELTDRQSSLISYIQELKRLLEIAEDKPNKSTAKSVTVGEEHEISSCCDNSLILVIIRYIVGGSPDQSLRVRVALVHRPTEASAAIRAVSCERWIER